MHVGVIHNAFTIYKTKKEDMDYISVMVDLDKQIGSNAYTDRQCALPSTICRLSQQGCILFNSSCVVENPPNCFDFVTE